MKELTTHVKSGNNLGVGQVEAAAAALLEEGGDVATRVEFLKALAEKGETPEEIAAFVEAFLDHAVVPPLDAGATGLPLLDVCGTGGDKLHLFNVSTTSMFVVAAGGVGVVKHGNRGITSKSGGADVLEALGVRIDLPPAGFAECIKRCGLGFMLAPQYHPAFKAVVPVRKVLAEEGCRTVFNLIGPLLNPVRPARQLLGVFSPDLVPAFAQILGKLGRECAWAVSGAVGDGRAMDELSTLAPTAVAKIGGGPVTEEQIDPFVLGFAAPDLEDLRGGGASENARILEAVLDGDDRGAKRDITVLNAGAGLVVAGVASSLEEGVAKAGELIDSGAASEKLRALRAFSA